MYILLLTILVSASITIFLLPRILLLSVKHRVLDGHDERKVHTVEASRLGGVSFLPAILISVTVGFIAVDSFGVGWSEATFTRDTLLVMSALVILFFAGVYDDIVGVDYKIKFLCQFISATIIVAAGCYIKGVDSLLGIGGLPTYVSVPLSVLVIVFITNAINLIDGIDGLASLLSIMAFMAYGIVFFRYQDYGLAICCMAALGALIPFCYLNLFGLKARSSTKIFMGDGGTYVIGLLIAIMAISLWNYSATPAYAPDVPAKFSWVVAYSMLIVPCFDVLRVMLRRARKHRSLFRADMSHFHHKLLAMGLSPRRVLVEILGINLTFLIINYFLVMLSLNITLIITIDMVLWVLMHVELSRIIEKKIKGRK